MSAEPNTVDAGERWDLARTLMLIAFIVAMVAALLVLLAWAVTLIKGNPVDPSLDKMSGMAFTFLTTMAAVATKFIDRVTQ